MNSGTLGGQEPSAHAPPLSITRRPGANLSHRVALGIILLYAIGIRLWLLPVPFGRNAEGVGCYYGVLARNYFRVDWSRTWGVPVQTVGQLKAEPLSFYHHHPPAVAWLVALTYAALGQSEWQTRLPSALFTIGCVVAVYAMLRRAGRPRAGLIAGTLFAAIPLTIQFGGQPEVCGTQLVFFVLLTVAAYLRLHRSPTPGNLLLTAAAMLGAGFSDWQAFFVVPVLCGHFVLTHPPRRWGWSIAFGFISAAIFMGIYAYLTIGAGAPWDWITRQVQRRSLGQEGDRGYFTMGQWFAGAARMLLRNYTLPLLVLAAAGGILAALSTWLRRRGEASITLLALLWAWGLLHVLIGRQGVYVHDWWWWPMAPALVMSAGWLLDELASAAEKRSWATSRCGRATIYAVLAGGLTTFAVLSTASTMRVFFENDRMLGWVRFSVQEMGDAIQLAAADANSPVMIAYNDPYDLQLWYYGDRPLKLRVWDPWTLRQRMDGQVDLAFGFTQDWPVRATGYILPKQFAGAVPGFFQEMKTRYPMTQTPNLYVFDLRRPVPGE